MKNLMKLNIILITILTLLIGCGDITLEDDLSPAKGIQIEELSKLSFEGRMLDKYIPSVTGIQLGIMDRYRLKDGIGIMEGAVFINHPDADNTYLQPIRIIILNKDNIYTQFGKEETDIYRLVASEKLCKDLYTRFITNLYINKEGISILKIVNTTKLSKDVESKSFLLDRYRNVVLKALKITQKI